MKTFINFNFTVQQFDITLQKKIRIPLFKYDKDLFRICGNFFSKNSHMHFFSYFLRFLHLNVR